MENVRRTVGAMIYLPIAILLLLLGVLAVSQFRGGKLGTRWNQGGVSMMEADRRANQERPRNSL